MSNEKRYEPQMVFDFSKWGSNFREFADTSTKEDGPQSVAVSNFLFNTVGVDKRNIATGGASDYEFVIHYPRPNLASSYGQSQWMPILLILALMDISPNKNNLLAISGGLDRYRFQPFNKMYGTKIVFLNSKKFNLYEKFQHDNTTPYSSISIQNFELDNVTKYDFMLAWSQDMENPFLKPDVFIDRLNNGGVLVIQNTSDSVFLYQNHTMASPVWSYHEELKMRDDCNIYHVPLFYGLTIVVKAAS